MSRSGSGVRECWATRRVIGITGGRDRWPTREQRRAMAAIGARERPILVHGGARGIDTEVSERAKKIGWLVICIKADWISYPKFGGHLRNSIIARSDILVTFGGGPGTANCVWQALSIGTPVVDLSGLWREATQ